MGSTSIYDDLNNTDLGEKVVELKKQNEKLYNHIKTLEEDIQKLCHELTKMKRNEDNLKNNVSSLFNTAKVEIERKDRMIVDLRKQLDDLLFKRSNVYSNGKQSKEQRIPYTAPNFNKRRCEIAELEPNTNKKQKFDLQGDSLAEVIRQQPALSSNAENHQEITRERESSYSKSPPRRGRSNSNRHRDRKRSRSRSNRSRGRDRSRSTSNNSSRSRNRNEENDKFCNRMIKEALSRMSSKYSRRISSENNSDNSKYKSDAEDCEKSKTNNGIIVTKNDIKKSKAKTFDNKHLTVKTATEKQSSPDNIVVLNNKVKSCAGTHQTHSKLEEFPDKLSATKENSHVNSIPDNSATSNDSDNFSFPVEKLDVVNNFEGSTSELKVTTCLQSSITSIETKSDTQQGSVNNESTHNITITNLNSNRTSINASRRRRCVIKIIS